MTTAPQPPLVRVEPLANPHRQWAGLLWTCGPGDTGMWEAWWAEAAPAAQALGLPSIWSTSEEAAAVVHADTTFPANTTALVRGHWYLSPPEHPSTAQAASRSQAMHLLQLVTGDADTRVLEDVFRREPALSYQLIKLVNAVGVGGGRRVTGFSQAILLLGRQALQRWLHLMLFAARDDNPRSALLLAHVAMRSRGMELLCKAGGGDRHAQEEAFLTGMFSMLGVLFGQPLDAVITPLKLALPVQQALLALDGPLGALLQTWQAMENGDFAGLSQGLSVQGVEHQAFNQLLIPTCDWSLQLTRGGPRGDAHG